MDSVVSLFSDSEQQYKRYAAALAATEPMREMRNQRAKQSMAPTKYWTLKMKKVNVCDVNRVDPRGQNSQLRAVCGDHVTTVTKIIRSLGLTVTEFNALSREVGADPHLRAKVMKQAFLFRIAAELGQVDLEQVPVGADWEDGVGHGQIATGPDAVGADSGASLPIPPVQQASAPLLPIRPVPLEKFVLARRAVELLRKEQADGLKAEMKLEVLPENICSPEYLPLLSPRVRSLCQSFPREAQDVVESHGLEVAQFNLMLEKTGRNPFLKWRLARQWEKLKAQVQTAD